MLGLKVSGTVAARMHHIPANSTTKRDASGGSVRSSRYARSVAASCRNATARRCSARCSPTALARCAAGPPRRSCCSTPNPSAGSPGSPSTTSSATAARPCCASATRHPRCPNRSPTCCSSTSASAPTCAPPPTASHAGCSPAAGRRPPGAGEPLQPSTLSNLVQALGVPSIAARAAAIRQHVLDLPAPIVATALGYHQVTTARLAAQAGTTWSNYAPGDRDR